MQRSADKVFVWSDVKLSPLAAGANYKNDRIYGTSGANSEGLRRYLKQQKPTGVKVLGFCCIGLFEIFLGV